MLKKDEVEELFKKECVLIGCSDAIPKFAVERIFGREAYEFAKGLSKRGDNGSLYGIGDYNAEYLTHKGFLTAATFCNVKEIKEIEGGMAQ